MKKIKENNKGITMISLVVTIIILLILAGVAILTLGENGLFEKAKIAKQRQTEADVKEKINLLVSEYTIEKEQGKTLSQFLTEKKDSGKIDDFVDNNDGTFDIIIDGYTTTINESNLSTTEPQILNDIMVTCLAKAFTENKVQALITVKSKSGGIKQVRLINNVTVQGNNKLVVAFDNKIEANTEYQIEVELTNGTIVTKTIKYEDIEAPTATIEIAKKIIFNSGEIQANIKLEDNRSGVNVSECKWVAVKSSEKLGTEDESKYTGTFKSETETIQTEEITEAGEYYIHLLLKDNVGNVTEVISEKIEIKEGYEISTPEEFQAIETNMAGHYYVTKDINMENFNFIPIKKTFTGTIDGQGHTISNLKINAAGYHGIFDETGDNVTIQNIIFKDINITNIGTYFGLFGGYAGSNNYFNKIGITGNISAIVGLSLGVETGTAYSSTVFENCYARVNVNTNGSFEGFCGRVRNSKLKNCYIASRIEGYKNGIFSEYDMAPITIENCFYNEDLCITAASGYNKGKALTTEQMADSSNYTGWNFNEKNGDWYMGEDGYPELKF